MHTKNRLNELISHLQNQSSALVLQDVKKQLSHQHCMICGTNSLLGLNLNFYSDENKSVWGLFKGNIHQQGYKGILHGGFLSALLDAGMCQAIFNQDVEAVTADMNIRFLHEVDCNSEMLIKGEVVSRSSILYKVKASIFVDSKLVVKAEARFMKKSVKK